MAKLLKGEPAEDLATGRQVAMKRTLTIVALALVSAALSPVAAADDRSVEERTSLATAEALAGAERWKEALEAVNHALERAPRWLKALLLRVKIQLGIAGPASTMEELARPRKDNDYPAIATAVRAAATDLTTLLSLNKDPARADRLIETIAGLRARAMLAESAARALGQRTAAPSSAKPAPAPAATSTGASAPALAVAAAAAASSPRTSLSAAAAAPALAPTPNAYAGALLREAFCATRCSGSAPMVGFDLGGRVFALGLQYGYAAGLHSAALHLRFGYEIDLHASWGLVPFVELSPVFGAASDVKLLQIVLRPGLRVLYRASRSTVLFVEPFALDVAAYTTVLDGDLQLRSSTAVRYSLGFGIQTRY